MRQKPSKLTKRRRILYRNLNKWQIPSKLPGGEIQPHLWYVIYEINLLKPKILNKAFKSKVHANEYINRNMSKYRTNLLYGKNLVDMGFNELHKSYRSLTGKYHKDLVTSGDTYTFDKELPPQRRKSLRTLFRRNLRRVLIKIVRDGKKEDAFYDR